MKFKLKNSSIISDEEIAKTCDSIGLSHPDIKDEEGFIRFALSLGNVMEPVDECRKLRRHKYCRVYRCQCCGIDIITTPEELSYKEVREAVENHKVEYGFPHNCYDGNVGLAVFVGYKEFNNTAKSI